MIEFFSNEQKLNVRRHQPDQGGSQDRFPQTRDFHNVKRGSSKRHVPVPPMHVSAPPPPGFHRSFAHYKEI